MAFWFTLSCLFTIVLSATYELPTDWRDNLGKYVSSKHVSHAVTIVNNGKHDIVSDNDIFALGYIDDDCGILVLIMYKQLSQTTLWEENHVQSDNGDCSESRSNPDWGEIKRIELGDNGNLMLYDFSDRLAWQSLENTNILLPGQQLHSGMTISTPYVDTYNMYARVLDGGLLITFGRDQTQPYAAWSIRTGGQTFNLKEVKEPMCPESVAVLSYTGEQLYMWSRHINSSAYSSCVWNMSFPLQARSSHSHPLILPYLGFSGGDFIIYTLDEGKQFWVEHSRLSSISKINNSSVMCRPYSILQDNGTCSECISRNDKGECAFTPPKDGDSCDGPNCTSYRNQVFEQVGYISNKFIKPYQTNTSIDLCESGFSAHNLNVTATFYNIQTRECFLYTKGLRGSLYKDPYTIAFLKVEVESRLEYTSHLSIAVTLCIFFSCLIFFGWTLAIIGLVIVKKYMLPDDVQQVEALLSKIEGLPQRFNYTTLSIATRGFTFKLGNGGFGSVYKGVTTDGKHIAVKKLTNNSVECAKQFITEIAGIGGTSHYNIVKLCGFCIEGATQKLLVYEFMPNGSLDRWLFDANKNLTWEKRMDIARGTARALLYLHEECSEPILHLDVKPQNILLDDKFVAKVADFGMAKLLGSRDVTQVQTCVRGTPGYLAPEWLFRNIATKKCDVYSYGMVLLEIIGGRKNIDLSKITEDDDSLCYFPAWVVEQVKQDKFLDVVDAKVRDSVENAKPIVCLALWCIQDNPSLRPTMHRVLEALDGQCEVEEPPMSFHFDQQVQEIIESATAAGEDNSTISMV